MTTILRIIYILFIGLFVAIIAYPFMHETGHTIMSLICGAKVIHFEMFPFPYVVCNISGLPKNSIVLIGMSGILFPTAVSVFIHPCKFAIWYPSLVFKGIVWLSLMISIVTAILSRFEITDHNDDMIKALNYCNNREGLLLTILVVLLLLMTRLIIIEHPIKRIYNAFFKAEDETQRSYSAYSILKTTGNAGGSKKL